MSTDPKPAPLEERVDADTAYVVVLLDELRARGITGPVSVTHGSASLSLVLSPNLGDEPERASSNPLNAEERLERDLFGGN